MFVLPHPEVTLHFWLLWPKVRQACDVLSSDPYLPACVHSSRSPMQCSSWTGRPACGQVPVRHCTDFLLCTHNFFLCSLKTPGGKDQSVVDTGSRHPHSKRSSLLSKYVLYFLQVVLLQKHSFKVHIFWEGHKTLRNLPLTFDYSTYHQKISEDFAKFCDLLRIYEL